MKFRIYLSALFVLVFCVSFFHSRVTAQQLITNGSFDGETIGWTAACPTCDVEATYFENTYGGTDGSNHVAEVDDQSSFYQDACVLPGMSYVFSMDASCRTTGGPNPESTCINIEGLDASYNYVATYVNDTFTRTNTVFALTPVAGIPVITVPVGSGVTYLRITFTDVTPGAYSTLGMIIDNISLVFQTHPVITGVDTTCKNTPQVFGISGISDTTITYSWIFGTNATPGTSSLANPSVSWNTVGVQTVYCVLGNGVCSIDTAYAENVFVRQSLSDTLYDSTCNGVPYTFLSSTYTQAGIYSDTFNSASGCDSIFVIDLYVRPVPDPPQVASPVYYCQYATAVPLSISGTDPTHWYTMAEGGTALPGAPVPATDVPGDVTYYVSQTSDQGCESQRAAITVHVSPQPAPPSVTSPGYCQNTIAASLVAIGDNLLWYTTPTGGTGSSIVPVVNTSTPGKDTFYVSQTINGCQSNRVPLIATVYSGVIAKFGYTIKAGCIQDTVVFTNLSTGATLYRWNFGDGHSDSSFNPTHIYTMQGAYVVQLLGTDTKCDSVFTDTITIHHPIKASFTTSADTICQGRLITFYNTSVGTKPVYFWDFGDGFGSIAPDTTAHVFTSAGVYQVKLQEADFVPCFDTAFKTVYVDSMSAINFSMSDSVLCEGRQIIFTGTYSDIGNIGNRWTFGDSSTVANDNPVVHAYDTIGAMQVTLTADYRACPDTSITKLVTIKPYPLLDLGHDTSMCPNSPPISINDLINAGNPQAHWLWSTGDTTSGILAEAPAVYYATVTVNGCSTSDSVWVKNDCYINIPNAFTPNGDGINDYFFPRQLLSEGLVSFRMEVYNRWGEIIFATTNTDGRGWDGKFNGVLQPQGVFIYIIDATFKDGQTEHHQGNVTLLR